MINKIKFKIFFNAIILSAIVLFYYKFPILENKNLDLNSNSLKIVQEAEYNYGLYDINYYEYYSFSVKKLAYYKGNWIGYISSDCRPMESNEPMSADRYIYRNNDFENPIPIILDNEQCKNVKKNIVGYFYVNKEGKIFYHLTLKEIKNKVKSKDFDFKNPKYFINKFGYDKGLNEIYFSRDKTERMFQNPNKIIVKMLLIKYALYGIILLNLILLKNKYKNLKKNLK